MTSDAGVGDGDGKMTINIQSSLPEGQPQGSFAVRVSPSATIHDLLRLVCKEAQVPLHSQYNLRTSSGSPISMNQQVLTVVGIQDGNGLLWTVSDDAVKLEEGCCNVYFFLALLSLLIGVVGLIAISIIYHKTPDHVQYGIVFDAGSSHTSMFIYKWEDNKVNLTAVAFQDGDKCTADGGGISSYINNTALAGQSLVQCLESAKSRIPDELHGSTQVYLGATAGMRLLRLENVSISEAVLESVRATISGYPFQFTDPKTQARILEGTDEGAFAWITSNYITGSFSERPPADAVVPDLIVKSVGALDLGGASTQITFVPNKTDAVLPKDSLFDLSLYGTNYSVYTHSYLCYGVNEAALRLQAALIEAANFSTNVSNPCTPEGNVLSITHGAIFSSACVSGQQAMAAFGDSIVAPEEVDPGTVYNFYGQSNSSACRAIVTEKLFNLTAACPNSTCSFNGVFQPPIHGDFYAFSSYFYLVDFLNLTATEIIKYEDFSQSSLSLCAKDWQEVKTMKGGRAEYLPWYCFQSIYVNTILVDGYKFLPNTTWGSIHFVKSISGTDAGWTLGFMLNESNELEATPGKKDLSTVAFSLLVVLFVLFILLTAAFLAIGRRRSSNRRHRFSFSSNGYGAI